MTRPYLKHIINKEDAGWSSLVARWAHNPKVAGSNPAPATNFSPIDSLTLPKLWGFFMPKKSFHVFFGDQSTAITPSDIKSKHCSYQDFSTVILQHQVHGNHGFQVAQDNIEQLDACLTQDGDYLITQEKNIGIGVLTADCLPIVFYDPTNQACGIAHAGWRGTVQEIALKTILHMQRAYNSQAKDLQIFFGPSAQACCYKVNSEFINNLPHQKIATKTRIIQKGDVYFDLPGYNLQLLESFGISQEQVDTSQNDCTICNTEFCSYRRLPEAQTRQVSIVCLY